MDAPESLLAAAHAISPEAIATRRSIHRRPELGYQEHVTAALVAERLRSLGIACTEGVAETGVIGVVSGTRPGKTVLLRADMDALPIQEDASSPFASEIPGQMHACGHDVHTAVLLGAARLLAERRERFAGTVKLMFQPAEEGGAGALRMIESGVLDDPPVDAAFALHCNAQTFTGRVGLAAGQTNASADRFTITVRGVGGHAARPQLAVDPIVVGAHIVTALQTIVSREVSPFEACVVTIGSLVSGAAFNVIPDTAVIKGTVRAFREDVRAHVELRISAIAQGIAAAMRATAVVEYDRGYPALVNDEAATKILRRSLAAVLGEDAIVPKEPAMAAEDFAFVLQRVPGSFFQLGVRNPAWKMPRPTHSPLFLVDEEAIPVGVAAMTAAALGFLAGPLA